MSLIGSGMGAPPGWARLLAGQPGPARRRLLTGHRAGAADAVMLRRRRRRAAGRAESLRATARPVHDVGRDRRDRSGGVSQHVRVTLVSDEHYY